jgi:parvulin-like peptidyl-prolyl isomerase
MKQSIVAQVAELNAMNVDQLAQRWKALYSTEPEPPLRNRIHLIKRLAYRIQELAYGGLPEETKAKLREVALSQEQEPRRKGGHTLGTPIANRTCGNPIVVTRCAARPEVL